MTLDLAPWRIVWWSENRRGLAARVFLFTWGRHPISDLRMIAASREIQERRGLDRTEWLMTETSWDTYRCRRLALTVATMTFQSRGHVPRLV